MVELQFDRLAKLIGEDAIEKLQGSHVAIFGIGGVGGYVCESLARCGIGEFDLIDKDEVDPTNINRQIIATHESIGRDKVEVMKERLLSINPKAIIHTHKCFFLPENAKDFDFASYDYIVDAIDTVTAKIELIVRANEAGVPIISAMGAGNKLDPSRFKVSDISKTQVCPLAKVMRRELRLRGIEHLKVVYSDEQPIKGVVKESGKTSIGSTAFAPAVCGLVMGAEIISDLTNNNLNVHKL